MTLPDKIRFAVITLSDRASKGEYEDLSGPAITAMIKEYFDAKSVGTAIENVIIPDDPQRLSALLLNYRALGIEVVFTTGGTGLGPRDFTPDVVKPLLDKEIPGVMEMIRVKYGMTKPAALISRSIAGVTSKTLVYCLPGSPKAVREYCAEILPTILHSIRMILGIDDHHC
jgi:molybdenum cofactor synthesis domain-containing protein